MGPALLYYGLTSLLSLYLLGAQGIWGDARGGRLARHWGFYTGLEKMRALRQAVLGYL